MQPCHTGSRPQNILAAALRRGGNTALGTQALRQLLRRTAGNQLAVREDQHIIANRLHLAQNMAGQDDRVGLAQFPDQAAHLQNLRGVQPDGRLVQYNDFRFTQQRGGNAHPLAVTLRQIADQPPPGALQPHAVTDCLYGFAARGFGANTL